MYETRQLSIHSPSRTVAGSVAQGGEVGEDAERPDSAAAARVGHVRGGASCKYTVTQ